MIYTKEIYPSCTLRLLSKGLYSMSKESIKVSNLKRQLLTVSTPENFTALCQPKPYANHSIATPNNVSITNDLVNIH